MSEGLGGMHQECLTPAHLDMPIFKSTDSNVDVTYMLWRFDVPGWLDQYDESSMIPHIFLSLQGYPDKWAHSLPEGRNISVQELLTHMNHMLGNMHDYNTMIRSLYEIRQKDSKTVEEYMLRIDEAMAVIHRAYPEWIPDQGKNLTMDRCYHGLLPSLRCPQLCHGRPS